MATVVSRRSVRKSVRQPRERRGGRKKWVYVVEVIQCKSGDVLFREGPYCSGVLSRTYACAFNRAEMKKTIDLWAVVRKVKRSGKLLAKWNLASEPDRS